jgi:hypothetical protein
MGTTGSFLGGKAAGAWSWPLTSILCRSQRMRGAIPPLPQHAFMAWCLVQHRDNITLPYQWNTLTHTSVFPHISYAISVQWFTPTLRIRDVPGSILGAAIGCPEWDTSLFTSVPSFQMLGQCLKMGHDHFLPHNSQSVIQWRYHSTLHNLRSWKCFVQ